MSNPLWYKDAIIYQLHIKAFADSNGDGIGDFRGLTGKLDYLADLGVTALWLLPFYPSPLRDDGYDIADYRTVHPSYDDLKAFRRFLREAHDRGLRVITELVLNHTSDQHAWFQRARRAKPGSSHRNFYVWSDTPDRYADARIIFQDFEASNWTWDSVAKAYYWHRFYSHQPDLNFDHPPVHKALLRVIDHWLGMGVDGVRLDAVPYLYEREGTNCENLPETHEFLKKLRAHVDGRWPDRMLLAEANQWPEDAAAYFGDGDECHMAFHFPVMPRMYMALQMEDRFPVLDILEQTPTIPQTCQWAMFLRNHDELTLEMVTDEERDYMYRSFARDPRARINLGIRRRLSPLMRNQRRRIELMNILLFSLPGTPIVYYGDEIGMGDNYYLGDRDGVRTPMQWTPDRNAGFSAASPHRLYLPVIIDPEYHYETVNVENQDRNPSSLLWWMRRVIAMRKRFQAFGRGDLEFVPTDNPKVLAFVRRYREEVLLVVVNLSRFAQVAQLDLAPYEGHFPEEVFSCNRFPLIRKEPYTLTMGFHDYFWFQLRPERRGAREGGEAVPELPVPESWREVLEGDLLKRLEQEILPRYMQGRRWFRSKARTLRTVHLVEDIPAGRGCRLALFQVTYAEGRPEIYQLPLAYVAGAEGDAIYERLPHAVVARLQIGSESGVLYDAVYDESFRDWMLGAIAGRRKAKGRAGEVVAYPGRHFTALAGGSRPQMGSRVGDAEQSNTAVLYDEVFFLKLYRAVEEGINPDAEVGRFLTERARFEHTPPFAGAMEYRRPGIEPTVVGLLQGFVPSRGDAWTYALDELGRFFERVLSSKLPPPVAPPLLPEGDEHAPLAVQAPMDELLGGHWREMLRLLGLRTAQMHRALARDSADPEFRPEAFSTLYQRSIYQSMRALVRRVLEDLGRQVEHLPPAARDEAREVPGLQQAILDQMKQILGHKLSGMKIRTHGDYHLGQVLYTGKDFVVIDFEGEPARPLSERRIKRSALRDVSGMLRSFHYAAHTSLLRHPALRPEDAVHLREWVVPWHRYVGRAYLDAYLEGMARDPVLPATLHEVRTLLRAFLLEKAVYEVGYELNNRPDWVAIPLQGIRGLLEGK